MKQVGKSLFPSNLIKRNQCFKIDPRKVEILISPNMFYEEIQVSSFLKKSLKKLTVN